MSGDQGYFVVKRRALPEVLLKVARVRQLMDNDRSMTVQEAADQVGISRSSYYKYKDDIAPFQDNNRGKNITFVIQFTDAPGALAGVLGVIAQYQANLLTIHMSIPINGVATSTICIEVLPQTGNVEALMSELENREETHYFKVLSRE